MKDSWRDDERCLEGEYYKEGDGIAEVAAYGTVLINDVPDTTMRLVRRGLKHEGSAHGIDANQMTAPKRTSKKETKGAQQKSGAVPKQLATVMDSPTKDSRSGSTYSSQRSNLGWKGDYLPSAGDDIEPRGRTHSRITLKTYGYAIKRALSPLEMASAMKDAIIGEADLH